jgi:hypothetical protein
LITEHCIGAKFLESSVVVDIKMAQLATFAAGCFWSVELAFQRVPGVTKVGGLLFI